MRLFEAERASRSATARATYFRGEGIPTGDVAGPVWQSWKRCQAAGHEPSRSMEFDTVGRSRIVEIEERSHALIAAAREEMQHVASVVSKSEMVALLSNEFGAIVHIAGDIGRLSPRLRMAARNGVDLGERAAGTNAVGTALVERSLVSIVAQEHYFESNAELTCVAAPVFGPSGDLIGSIDVSGDRNDRRPDCIGLVEAAAYEIENNLLRNLRNVVLVTFGPRAEWLATPWEGLLAFDAGGQVVAGNGRAMALLGIVGERPRVRFEDVFDSTTFGDVLDRANRSDQRTILQSAAGLRFAARIAQSRVTRPARVSRPRSGQSSGDKHGDQSRRASTLAFLHVVTGDSPTAQAFERARRAAALDVPVLLVGETGTGKELVARSLHYLSSRSERPFVAVSCAAFPESLVEAELFGYAEGAFTGARRGGAAGKVELAHEGTLFLDEIGDMPVSLQSRLLRVLQERSVVRLGESRERPANFALICATHCDLPDLIRQRLFREDLYYRINGLSVALPPLRLRANILEIAEFFLDRRCRKVGKQELSESARNLLLQHPWPGNLRQLDHVITVAVALMPANQGLIETRYFPDDFVAQSIESNPSSPSCREPAPGTLDQAATDLIERTIQGCGGNVSAAARALKISRSTIYNRWRRL